MTSEPGTTATHSQRHVSGLGRWTLWLSDDTSTVRKESSDWHLSLVAIGSPYWAAYHPRHAWRVLLPIQPDDGSEVSADLKTICSIAASVRVPRGLACQ
jgi:hypothetical protein